MTMQRLRSAKVGAAGLAALLGSGLCLLMAQEDAGAARPVAVAQPEPAQTVPPADAVSAQTLKAIRDARASAAADGFPEMRPPGQQHATMSMSTTSVSTADGTVQITSASGDLHGITPQALAGDAGQAAGAGVSCTRKLRFSASAPARTMPHMLLCWKTSAERSVVTMAAARTGSPSVSASAAYIAREWAKLG